MSKKTFVSPIDEALVLAFSGVDKQQHPVAIPPDETLSYQIDPAFAHTTVAPDGKVTVEPTDATRANPGTATLTVILSKTGAAPILTRDFDVSFTAATIADIDGEQVANTAAA